MVAANKQKIFSKLLTALAKQSTAKFPKDLSVLDHLLIAVLQENASPTHALDIYRGMIAGFHDFNELRVSHPKELEDVLDDLPEAQSKARRIIAVLQFVFETTYDFDLESMRKKPLKQAMRQLSKIIGITPFAVTATVQRALGGHAIPLDERILELLKQLDLLEVGDSPESIRTALEHLVPKAKGLQFSTALAELASDDDNRDDVIDSIVPQRERPMVKRPTRKEPVTALSAASTPTTNGVAHGKAGRKSH